MSGYAETIQHSVDEINKTMDAMDEVIKKDELLDGKYRHFAREHPEVLADILRTLRYNEIPATATHVAWQTFAVILLRKIGAIEDRVTLRGVDKILRGVQIEEDSNV